ncbi:SHOCT domain-containing protein [Agromyces sp. G08B096]|uniref:SHOCT domain-containing protein n=1 Tax=Agromyces sp. G08B096 TaxID=3156399 RepID=A0AAU7W2C3_9MICO
MAARTAVVAGTATAVSGNVARRQNERAERAYEAQQYELSQAAAQVAPPHAPAQAVAAAPTTGGAGGVDVVAELQKLSDLKAQGVLNDAEFEAAKTKLLA